ncbi:MAG TPA: serine/threonine-protein kinase [Kofleriaceae bacterium]|nr:serine/threonine-protein kinase [Kofleriaceae bacterium]
MSSGDELATTATSAARGQTAETRDAPSRPSGTPPGPGDTIGRYVIERVLGTGGMGVVFAAHDPDLDRRVALKLLHGAGSTNGDEARTRLLREARAMAKVNHPNVITVYEVGTAQGVDFVAMELIEGTNGADWLRKTRRAAPDILRMLTSAGRGLVAAHAMGLVHRDFKPANILISHGGKVVVTDFGLARAFDHDDGALATTALPSPSTTASTSISASGLEETVEAGAATPAPTPSGSLKSHSADLSSTITRTGALLGTPAYMAPEQFAGQHAGPKADQYALCIAIWEGLAGARPFRGTSFDELKQAVDRGPASAADADKIPRRLRGILERGLARDPAARWPDVDALLTAIDRAERRPRQLAFGAIALLAVIGLAALVYFSRGGTHTTTRIVAAAAECGISDADLAEAWSPQIGAKIASHVGDEAVWAKHGVAIDRVADTWRAERAETCKHPEAREFHGRVACLLAVRDELAAIIDLGLTLPPDVIRNAQISEVLPDPTGCRTGVRTAAPQLPDDPAERAALSALYREGTTAVISARMGKYDQARALGKPALERARVEKNPLRLSLALQFNATVEQIAGNCKDAETLFAEAAVTAERARAGGIRAMSAMGQLECFMGRSSDLDAIRRVAQQAEAAVEGAGGDRVLRAGLDMQLADIDALAGDIDQAIARTEKARVVFSDAKDGRRGSLAAAGEAALLTFRNAPGDYDRAVQLIRDSARDVEASFGRTHPLTQRARWRLGFFLLTINPDEARAIFTELAAMPQPPDPDEGPLDTSVHARGRVLGPDGTPVAGATVDIGTFLLCGDDGISIPTASNDRKPTSVTTDANGRFDAHVARHSLVHAHHGDLRAVPLVAGDRELTLKLGPALSATGTIRVPTVTVPAGAERAATLAARASRPDALVIGAGHAVLYQCIAHRLDDEHWEIHGLPGDPSMRAVVAVNTGLNDRIAFGVPIGQAKGAPIDLRLDLDRPALDIIVRADRAAAIPTAQVLVFDGKLTRPPTTGIELILAMGTSSRWSGGTAAPVVDTTRTQAGAAHYQPGDIHARFAAFGPGPVTACVVPYSGDVADAAFLRSLPVDTEPDARCQVFQVAPSPRVQAFVLTTPPMKRTK